MKTKHVNQAILVKRIPGIALMAGMVSCILFGEVAIADDEPEGSPVVSAVLSIAGDVYALESCGICRSQIGESDSIVLTHDGREFRFCSRECTTRFRHDPEKYLDEIEAAIIEQQIPLYPEAVCLNSRESWGDNPIDRVFRNRLLRFCCPGCGSEVMESIAESGSHVRKLDAMIVEQQRPSYSLTTCVVSGRKLDGSNDPVVEFVTGNRLVLLCCSDCIEGFRTSPAKYLAKLDAAADSQPE